MTGPGPVNNRMLYSLKHKKKMVNGATGFYPPQWNSLIGRITNDFPKDKIVDELIAIGINYVIVHKNELNEKEKLNTINKWGGGRVIYEDEQSSVFLIQ